MRTRTPYGLASFLLVLPLCAGQAETLLIYAGRPITYAATAISEVYGSPVTFEESGYEATHPLRALFPGAAPLYPKAVRLKVHYEPTSDMRRVLEEIVWSAAVLHPEQYAVAETSEGVWGIMPKAGAEPSDIPLDVAVHLPDEPVTTAAALDAIAAQVAQTLPNVTLQVVRVPRQMARRTSISVPDSPLPARELLNRVTGVWTEQAYDSRHFFVWRLKYGAGQSTPDRKVFVVSFQILSPARRELSNLFAVESIRPMHDAARLLEDRFGIPITLEEPPALCNCELMGHPGTANVAVRGGIIEMRWNDEDSLREMLLRLIDATRRGDANSGAEMFQLDWNDNRPVLKPTRMRNEESEIVEYRPLLDVDITDQLGPADDLLTLAQIATIVSAKSGRRLVAGAEDDNVEENISGSLTLFKPISPDVTLQKVLTEGLSPADANVTFHLLYDPVLQGHRLIARRMEKT